MCLVVSLLFSHTIFNFHLKKKMKGIFLLEKETTTVFQYSERNLTLLNSQLLEI